MPFGSLTNQLYPTGRLVVPEVGMGATMVGWSDRHPYTIVYVSKSRKLIKVQADDAFRTDDNGMSECQSYKFTPNLTAEVLTVRLTKTGWKSKGTKFSLGQRDKYHDYSF